MTTSESPQIMKACPDESQDQIPLFACHGGNATGMTDGRWADLDRESIFELKDGDLSFASVYFQ